LSKARHSLMFYSKARAYPRGKQLKFVGYDNFFTTLSLCFTTCIQTFCLYVCPSVRLSDCLSVFLSPHSDYLLVSLHSFHCVSMPTCFYVPLSPSQSLSLSLLFVEYSKCCCCTNRNKTCLISFDFLRSCTLCFVL
jgi:hypothetical protein